MALRRPDVRVETFDIDATARFMCRLTCKANGVSNVYVGEAVTDAVLAACGAGTVLLSDCEGAEAVLLDPQRYPGLAETNMLVEVHDFINPAISNLLRERFDSTHTITEYASGVLPQTFKELEGLSDADRDALLTEGRPAAMSWFLMVPRD